MFVELIKNTQPAFIALFGTLSVVVITQIVGLIAKWIDSNQLIKMKQIDINSELEKNTFLNLLYRSWTATLNLCKNFTLRNFQQKQRKRILK